MTALAINDITSDFTHEIACKIGVRVSQGVRVLNLILIFLLHLYLEFEPNDCSVTL